LLTVTTLFALLLVAACAAQAAVTVPRNLKPPTRDGIRLRPAAGSASEPTIGFADGIRIALWPAPDGPRGLVRISAPYVFPPKARSLINLPGGLRRSIGGSMRGRFANGSWCA